MASKIYLSAATALAIALGCALTMAADVSHQVLLAARYTARAAFLFFFVVVASGPAARLWPDRRLAPVLANRRHFGLATAALMLAHLIAVAINVHWFRPRSTASLAGGAVVYLLLLIMVATSNAAMRARLKHRWRLIHGIGLGALFLAFGNAYVGRLLRPDYFIVGAAFTLLLVGVVALRLGAWLANVAAD